MYFLSHIVLASTAPTTSDVAKKAFDDTGAQSPAVFCTGSRWILLKKASPSLNLANLPQKIKLKQLLRKLP